MEETGEFDPNQKCIPKIRSFRGRNNPHNNHYQQHLLQNSNRNGFCNQNQYQTYPALLPLPPTIPLPLSLAPTFPQNHNFRTKAHLQKPSWKHNNTPIATSSDTRIPDFSVTPGKKAVFFHSTILSLSIC